jgi:hypothetical protein
MAYVRRQQEGTDLRAEIVRLKQENRNLILTHTRERKQWAKQAGERLRVLEKAKARADKIITDAYGKAKAITMEAEAQAAYIRERAYDWGRAAADRDYVSVQAREADERRHRERLLGKVAA